MNDLKIINKKIRINEDFNKKYKNFFFSRPENQSALSSLCSSNLIIVTMKQIKNIINEILEKNFGRIKKMYKK
jgi:hypothetical protein